jgi:hypothetical protein
MPTSGVAVYSPVEYPSIVDASLISYASGLTLNGATTAPTATVVVSSAAALVVGQWILLDVGAAAEVTQITAIATNTLTVYPVTGRNHATGVAVGASAVRQRSAIYDPTAANNGLEIQSNGSALVALADNRYIITSGSPITATMLQAFAGNLVSFWSTGGDLETQFLRLYDVAIIGNIAQATCIWGDGSYLTAFTPGTPITLHCPFVNGLAYTLTAALPTTANIVISVA